MTADGCWACSSGGKERQGQMERQRVGKGGGGVALTVVACVLTPFAKWPQAKTPKAKIIFAFSTPSNVQKLY